MIRPGHVAGVLLGLGALISGWLLADVVFGGWAVWLAVRHRHYPPVWAVATAAAFLPGVLWSSAPLVTGLTAVRVLGVASVGGWLLRRDGLDDMARGVFASVALATGAAVSQFASGVLRPGGLYYNASELGQAGVGAWAMSGAAPRSRWLMLGLAAVAVPVSGARAAMAAVGLSAAGTLSGRRLFEAGNITIAFIALLLLSGQAGRLISVPTVAANVAHRAEIATNPPTVASEAGTGAVSTAGPPAETPGGEPAATRYSATGYGVGASVTATGRVRPHNWPQALALEMGVLALVPAAVLAWAAWTRRLPVWALLGMLPLALLTDEWVATPGGHYLAAVYVLAAARFSRQ